MPPADPAVARAKDAVRRRIWTLLEQSNATRGPAHGRIPDFLGAAEAADLLARQPVWRSARVVKAVPDHAQLPVRARALAEGKLVYMAVPKLAGPLPFFVLDPATLPVAPEEAASRQWAEQHAPQIGVEDMRPVDLVVCGSVAVNRQGARLGKGAGYSDIELGLLQEAGLLSYRTTIATTVHPLQVLDEPLPEGGHDFRVDLIVTATNAIKCGPSPRPPGVAWEELDS